MKYITQKIKQEGMQCSLCAAKVEVWINNSKISDERKEKMRQNLLAHCPVCGRASEIN